MISNFHKKIFYIEVLSGDYEKNKNKCKVSYIRCSVKQHPSSKQVSHISNISHPKLFTSKHLTSQIFISQASQITNIAHPKHSTSPISHISNIPNPKHPTSQTSHILNIPRPKHSTSKHLRFHRSHIQKLQILNILYTEEKIMVSLLFPFHWYTITLISLSVSSNFSICVCF